jgi:hexosaminidase
MRGGDCRCTQPLNPASSQTFELIEALLGECTGGGGVAAANTTALFPEQLIHLGGDEVDTSCWGETPEVAQWLQARGMSAEQGYGYFGELDLSAASFCEPCG